MKKSYIFFISTFITVITIFSLTNKLNTKPINESTKTCLITGASHGIGYELSKEMIKRKWKVIGIARGEKNLNKTKQALGEFFIPYKCDVSNQDQVYNTSEKIKLDGLQPTLFFLNAGIGDYEENFQSITNKHKKIFDTNYFGTIYWIDEWINNIKNWGGGTFVATSSLNAIFAYPNSAGYCASKAALNICFKTLRLQYINENIGFVIAMPGPVDTLPRAQQPPFTLKASNCAQYIVKNVFKGKKEIEPSWYYSWYFRIKNLLPDKIRLKI